MEIVLANPRGFCAGVSRAIEIVEQVLSLVDEPVYVRHEVVHNRFVVEDLKKKGAIFVDELDEVPDGATVIYSAHGVSQAVRRQAKEKQLTVFDATCPLVTKVHIEVAKAAKENQECILVGHKGHPEVEGTLGQYLQSSGQIYLVESVEDVYQLDVKNPENLVFSTQTTLSVNETNDIIKALQQKYPLIKQPKKEDICYATTNRQNAVYELANEVDVVLVVGSKNSSNSNRLKELAQSCGINAYLLDNPDQVEASWFRSVKRIGVTAGASAPEVLVEQIVNTIKQMLGDVTLRQLKGVKENITFPLPKVLKKLKQKETC
ncbi:4-hydroxy-3-methylbut-2-enyl diphosphate reductase [Thiotrichales bacterium 19S9-12]|nr:4-hydroxy-3-methylbut-2-enyl diphosphate reductase [Thiotrichales bacterium 19S9-11]MCF6811945.1 4-hydroxy-3-methylbut-2-enyl diphosphate reductase [Thiotrichales bacterium 19S9-12]